MAESPSSLVVVHDRRHVWTLIGAFIVALSLAAIFPLIDHRLNPAASEPGVITYAGVGLSILGFTWSLLYAGMIGNLPRTGVFAGAFLGYSSLLILVKFVLAPMAVYGAASGTSGLDILGNSGGNGYGYFAFPTLAATTAVLYGLAFFALTIYFRSGLRRRLGLPIKLEQRFVTLLVFMFVLGTIGAGTGIGIFSFLEYGFALTYVSGIALLIGAALIGALALCTAAFQEVSSRAVMLRDVTVFTGFAWTGLAFIAAYHVLWLVFILIAISLWPVKSVAVK